MIRSGLACDSRSSHSARCGARANEPSARLGSGVRGADAALRNQGHARIRTGRNAVAGLDGGRAVSVASSPDGGRSFSAPAQVTKERLNLDWGPDARPKIVVDRKGGIALAFSIFRDKAFNGQVLYTRSERRRARALPSRGRSRQQREPAL